MVINIEFTVLVNRLSQEVGMVFKELVTPLVKHELGWSRYGYNFIRVNKGKASQTCKHFTIILTPELIMVCLFPDFAKDRLSVCNMRTNIIYINEARWLRLIPDQSQLDLPEYRAYVISHEIGHILGLGHATSPACNQTGDPAPTMMQQTLGIQNCSPSPWPKPNELNDFYL